MKIKPKILITTRTIKNRIAKLGAQIDRDYKGKEITIIGILKGSFIFVSDLVRDIKVPVRIDFMEVASYGDGKESSGVVKFVKDLTYSIEGKHVILVDDIIETGLTMDYLIRNLRTRKPKSLKICCLLNKPQNRKIEVPVDYIGFNIEDKFVLGYGLDYQQLYRNLNAIGYLSR
jgi:hypoxanthine phosphoribosyltransferase